MAKEPAKELPKKALQKIAVFAKGQAVQLYAGVDLIGSKMSLSARDADLNMTHMGMIMVSKKTKRVILIPWSNVKGAELVADSVSFEE